MAFMCPIRIGRSRNKKERQEKLSAPTIGRITGSASIETLVRVGLEKEQGLSSHSKAVVLHDFNPCVDDELGVKRGEIIHTLYQENDWMYVISADGSKEGFIPQSYCAAVGSQLATMALNFSRKKPRELSSDDHHLSSLESSIAHSDVESVGTSSCGTDVHPFFKDPAGRYLVLYTFVARDENDLSVERGELVTVLNREDPDWFWVLRSDGQEGFVPSAFVYPADMIESHAQSPDTSETHSSTVRQEATSQTPTSIKKLEIAECQKEYRYDTKSGTISQNLYHNSSIVNAYDTVVATAAAVRVEVNNNDVGNGGPMALGPMASGGGGGCSSGGGGCGSRGGNGGGSGGGGGGGNVGGGSSLELVRSAGIVASGSSCSTSSGNSSKNSNNTNHNSNNSRSGCAIVGISENGITYPTGNESAASNGGSACSTGNVGSGGAGSSSGQNTLKSEGKSSDDQTNSYRAKGTELVMLYDYKGDAEDDLEVKRGEWVYADLNRQTVELWLWAYSPRLNKYGFIPKAYARPPAMTSL